MKQSFHSSGGDGKSEIYVTPQSRHYYTDYEDDCEIHRPLTVDRVERGTVHPCEVVAGDRGFEEHLGGVTDSGGNFVPTSGNHRSASEFRRMVRVANPKPANVRRVHETVIFGGVLYEYYGHALIESMSRLWYFLRDNPEHHRVVFLQTPRAKGKFRELFDLLGIPYDETTFITEPTQYDCVIVPERSFTLFGIFHRNWLVPFDYLRSKVTAKSVEKLFFARLHVKRNPILNERYVCDVFRRAGYTIVFPEEHPIAEQIAYLKGAKSFATWAGSLTYQTLFCNEGVERIVLNRAWDPEGGQQAVDQARHVRNVTIDCSLNPIPTRHTHGPWIVGKSESLAAFCESRGWRCPGKVGAVSPGDLAEFMRWWPIANADLCDTEQHAALAALNIGRTTTGKMLRILSHLMPARWREFLRVMANRTS